MATHPIRGLHHVTAIASDPQRNLDFYTGILGLRFVKKTINFDDPGTYHFYFGDDAGSPGTILTFFPWPGATRGRLGTGEVSHTAFSIPSTSLSYWEERLTKLGIAFTRGSRFNEQVITLGDPDGMKIELVGFDESTPLQRPRFADVPTEHAIRGFFGVTMLHRDAQKTEAALAMLGFALVAKEGARLRFAAAGDALGNHIDIVVDPQAAHGRLGSGSVHHIAFRSTDFEDQKEWLATIGKYLAVSQVMERDYFRSIYFREPGGVLFELATDIPGFTADEPLETLGEALCIPEWMDAPRRAMSKHLIPVTLHKAADAVSA